jgi:hypothetical protein
VSPLVVLALIFAALAGVVLVWARPRISSRWNGIRALRRLGPGSTQVPPETMGPTVTLSGELVVIGPRCERFEDGASVAAATLAVAYPRGPELRDVPGIRTRAGSLALRVGDAVVALEGPVDVLAGSEETWVVRGLRAVDAAVLGRVREAEPPARIPRLLARRGIVMRSVRGGDRVRVAGRLQPLPLAGAGQAAWSLAPVLGGVIGLAFEGAPQVPGVRARSVARAAAMSGVVLLMILGLGGRVSASGVDALVGVARAAMSSH